MTGTGPILFGVLMMLLAAGGNKAAASNSRPPQLPPPLPPRTPAPPARTQTPTSAPRPAAPPAARTPAPRAPAPKKLVLPPYSPVEARETAPKVAAHLASQGRDHYRRDALKIWQALAGLVADGLYGGATRGALIYYGVPVPPAAFFKPTATKAYVPPGTSSSSSAAPRPSSTAARPRSTPAAPRAAPVRAAAPVPRAAPARAAAPVRAPIAKPLGKVVAQQEAQQQAKPPAAPAEGVRASPELEPNRGSLPTGYNPTSARSRAQAMAAHLAKKGPANYSHPELRSWQTQAGLHADGLYGGSSRGALIYFGVKDPPRPFFKPVATLPYVPPEQRV
jgi:hypothetical protein